MNTKFFALVSASLAVCSLALASEDLRPNGVNTECYRFEEYPRTEAPKGYKPVYLSHYGRHGSRTTTSKTEFADYAKVVDVLKEAQKQKLLTAAGDSLLSECVAVMESTDGMIGALTRIGEAEQHKLAELLYSEYKPVFRNGPKYVRVQNSNVPRSIVSGECFVQTLTSLQSDLRFSFDTGDKIFAYIDNGADKEHRATVTHLRDSLAALSVSDGVEFCKHVFRKPKKGLALIGDPDEFQRMVWYVAREGAATGVQTDMFRHLPEDVVAKWWTDKVVDIYMNQCNSVEFGDRRMKRAEPLVKVMLEQARQALECGTVAADLKFGHDYPLVATAGYFGFDGVGGRYTLSDLPGAWADPMNIPFASNLQMAFYRNDRTGDVLVKFVYNGKEKTIAGLEPVCGPYYRWSEVYEKFIPEGDERTFAHTDWGWRKLADGAEVGYAQVNLFNSVQSISVIRYPMDKVGTFIANDSADAADSTSALALRHGGIAAVNASYFNVKTLYPTTYTKDDGHQEGWTTPAELFRVDGLVAIRKNGKDVRIFKSDTLGYDAVTKGYKEALAGGPVLLLDGEEARASWPYTSFYYLRHPRTFVGTTADGMVYLVVIDGRFPGQGIGATIHETATIARLFGLKDAINLDGGGSSTLWTKEFGTINHPYDNKRFDHFGQRVVPNIIYIR